MNSKQKEKMERYFKNTGGVFWGVIPENKKKEIYKWLKEQGYSGISGSYGEVISRFLENPGIEGILTEIIIPIIEETPLKAMRCLRRCWRDGIIPDGNDLEYLKRNDHTFPFLEIDGDSGLYKWSVFAGLWFEEIEPMKKTGKDERINLHIEKPTNDRLIKISKSEDRALPEIIDFLCEFYENNELREKVIRLETQNEMLRRQL